MNVPLFFTSLGMFLFVKTNLQRTCRGILGIHQNISIFVIFIWILTWLSTHCFGHMRTGSFYSAKVAVYIFVIKYMQVIIVLCKEPCF